MDRTNDDFSKKNLKVVHLNVNGIKTDSVMNIYCLLEIQDTSINPVDDCKGNIEGWNKSPL